jgi:hypothetical protein
MNTDDTDKRMKYYYGPTDKMYGEFKHPDGSTWWRVCVNIYTDYWREKFLDDLIYAKKIIYSTRILHPSYNIKGDGYNRYVEYHHNIDCDSKEQAIALMDWLKKIDNDNPPDYRYIKDHDCEQIRFRRYTKKEIDEIYQWCIDNFQVDIHQLGNCKELWEKSIHKKYVKIWQGSILFYDKQHAMLFKLTFPEFE